ncbi:MAG: SRPBCC domain-containing protein, partial [Anaerolineales bacterium]
MEIHVSFEVEGSKEEIWSRLVEDGGLKKWLGADELKMDLYEEGTFALDLKQGGSDIEIAGETSLLVPPEKIGLTWIEQRRGRDLWAVPTTVIFSLEDHDKTGRLTVTH